MQYNAEQQSNGYTYQEHSKAGQMTAAADGFVLCAAVRDTAAIPIPASWTF